MSFIEGQREMHLTLYKGLNTKVRDDVSRLQAQEKVLPAEIEKVAHTMRLLLNTGRSLTKGRKRSEQRHRMYRRFLGHEKSLRHIGTANNMDETKIKDLCRNEEPRQMIGLQMMIENQQARLRRLTEGHQMRPEGA